LGNYTTHWIFKLQLNTSGRGMYAEGTPPPPMIYAPALGHDQQW